MLRLMNELTDKPGWEIKVRLTALINFSFQKLSDIILFTCASRYLVLTLFLFYSIFFCPWNRYLTIPSLENGRRKQ